MRKDTVCQVAEGTLCLRRCLIGQPTVVLLNVLLGSSNKIKKKREGERGRGGEGERGRGGEGERGRGGEVRYLHRRISRKEHLDGSQ